MSDTNLFGSIECARYAGRAAMLVDGREIRYSELIMQIDAVASSFHRAGITRSHRVIIPAYTGLDTVLALLGCWRLGAVAVPVNPKLPKPRLDDLVGRVSPFRACPEIASAYSAEPDGFKPVRGLDYDATIVFTSGSSGDAKAAMHSMGNHIFSALGSNELIPLDEGDRWLLSLPLFHVGGLAILFRCFLAGATVVLPDSSKLGDQLEATDITHLSCVPTQLIRLLNNGPRLDGLKALLLGGAVIPPGLFRSAEELGVPVYQTYGCTEMSSQVCTGRECGNSGKLLNYRELTVSDSGEILVRGKTLFRGYVNHLQVDPARDDEGWFHTGDLGALDSSGLKVTGRKDNMFISGGENIQPEEIERVLLSIDGVDQAIVVPRPDYEFGMRPVAFLSGQWEELVIRTELAHELPGYMLPVEYRAIPESNALKPNRAELAARMLKDVNH